MTAAFTNGNGGRASRPGKPIRVLIIDDHLLFSQSLAYALNCEPDLTVEYSPSIREAIPRLSDHTFDLVLLDYDLKLEVGSEFVPAAEKIGYTGLILVVTAWLSHPAARSLLRQGVNGIFLKHDELSTLLAAIRAVAAGGFWVDPSFRQLARDAAEPSPGAPPHLFTELQYKVLRLVLEGLSNKEIGQQMQISESYVKAIIQMLFQKTGVRTRGQLVRLAVEQYS